MTRLFVILSLVLALVGCGGPSIEEFAGTQPKLVLEDYFNGQVRGWGMFHDRFGRVKRQFVVDIAGTWDGSTLTLDEKFRNSDGSAEGRVWRVRKLADGRYEGQAGDVDGPASGVTAGQALQWSYHLMLKVDDSTWRVHMDDWMYLQPDGVLINRTVMSKWGFELGTLSLFLAKGR